MGSLFKDILITKIDLYIQCGMSHFLVHSTHE